MGLTWGRARRSSARPPTGEAADRAARLRQGLHTRIEECRRALEVERKVTEALVRAGELDGAAHALEDQRLLVRALSSDVKAALADAATEQALNAWRNLPVKAGTGRSRGLAGCGVPSRRSGLALALAAAMLGLVLVPGLREQPLRMLAARDARDAREERVALSQIHAARERLAAFEPARADAEEVAAQTRAVHDRILSLPDRALASEALRAEILGLLAEQSGALRDLQGNVHAKSLLAEVHALSASLGLELPEPPDPPPTTPASEVPLPPALEQAPLQQPAPEQLVPEPEKPTPELVLPEQPAPERPSPGNLNVRPADQAPRPHPPEARAPNRPKSPLQP